MNYTQQLKQKDSEYVWHNHLHKWVALYSKEEAIIIEKERVVTITIRDGNKYLGWLCIVVGQCMVIITNT